MSCVTSSPDQLAIEQLHERMLVLSRQEREATLSVIDHLIEIESLRVHQRRGHSSLYTYCINELGYSRRSAHLRIVAARTVRRWPRVKRLLKDRRLTLSTLAAVADSLTPVNYRALLNRVCGKSHPEVERILAELRGVKPARERISQITTVAKGDSGVGTKLGLGRREPGGPSTPDSQSIERKSITPAEFTGETRTPQPAQNTTDNTRRVEQRYQYEFSGSEAFMRKYQKAASLLSNRLPKGVTIEAIFELLLDDYLDRNDPARREQRREARRIRARGDNGNAGNAGNAGTTSNAGNAGNAGNTSNNGDPGETGNPGDSGRPALGQEPTTGTDASPPDGVDGIPGHAESMGGAERRASAERRIPAEMRDRVHVRDEGQCTFRGHDGQRCGETRHLHIDHIVPWSLGGPHEPSNLRLLCAAHNQLQADRAFGTGHMARFRRHE